MIKKLKAKLSNISIESYFSILRIAVAIGIALLIAFILIYCMSDTPLDDFMVMILEPFSTRMRRAQIINKFIPYLFTGTCVCIMLSTGQVTTSTEGAFYFAGVAGTAVALIPGLPSWLHIPLCFLAAFIAGAIVTVIPTFMNVRYGIITIVASMMVNNVFLYLGQYLIFNPMRDPVSGYEASYKFQTSAILPKLFNNRYIHIGLIIGLIIVVLAWILLYKTPMGTKMRTVGYNSKFAELSGISVMKYSCLAACIAGGIAGMGGIAECLGNYERFVFTGITSHGWNGIVVAVLSKNNPKYAPIAALFLAYLSVAGDCLNFSTIIPTEIIDIVQPIMIIFVAAPLILKNAEHKAIVRKSEKELEKEEA